MSESWKNDLRLIEAGFPCHQVGAETQRERGASSALPPLYYLHVWWARRPLTPSRAAVLASLLPADTDPDWFLRQLGIEKKVVEINGVEWTLTGKLLDKVQKLEDGQEILEVDDKIINELKTENKLRLSIQNFLNKCKQKELSSFKTIIEKWEKEASQLPSLDPGTKLEVKFVPADPDWANEKKALGKASGVWFPGDPYGYKRAFQNPPFYPESKNATILDPTSGGGSIPFEALRLGYKVIANELNPVASVILHSTLDYPARYGFGLVKRIEEYGSILLKNSNAILSVVFPDNQALPESEVRLLKMHLSNNTQLAEEFNSESIVDYLYCRQVICPNCHGDAPLLNTCWLSKEDGKQWGIKIVPDGRQRNGKVRFEIYRASKGKGPAGEDPGFASVTRGIGTCIHCKQAISAEEIKSQARGESALGRWKDRLYCVVAVRFQPRLDKNGKPLRYKSGDKKGEIKTEKIRFFRPPNEQDFAALKVAENRLKENWDRWESQGLIPTEKIPLAHKTKEPLRVGMERWCDMFTPRQLLGHLHLVEELNRLKPEIISELGQDKARAVITYLQFAIDKGVDYNSRQTRWEYTRGIVKGNFGRHDFSLKWTFGEMIFSGPNSGFAWCLSQIYDAYKGMAELMPELVSASKVTINCGTAAYMPFVPESSVDLVCMDPPYYNNVQYAELSDYFYVWQKRTLGDLYPDYFKRRLTDKQNEAVANPDRDGGARHAQMAYEKMMTDIFQECRRVLKPMGILTLMFTHKSQDAWEALTRSLITSGWTITATVPVESESSHSMHLMDKAGAASSIFISCRKRTVESQEPALWSGFGGSGVQHRIQQAVKQGLEEFQVLKLNPVDEMVASYGRALRVLSEQWPVIDGEEEVGPIRAMNEASRVVSENQIQRITNGRLKVTDLSPEAAMAVTLFGIFRTGEIPFDQVLNISKSLNIAVESKTGGYNADGRFIGYNSSRAGSAVRGRTSRQSGTGCHAPLVRKGSKLRVASPEERHPRRLEFPQTEWDTLCGVIMAYREGDIPVARAYMDQHTQGKEAVVLDLLGVWATEIPDEALKKEAHGIIFGLR